MTKKEEIHNIYLIKDKKERAKRIVEYMKANVIPSEKCKTNVYAEASVIFDGRLL